MKKTMVCILAIGTFGAYAGGGQSAGVKDKADLGHRLEFKGDGGIAGVGTSTGVKDTEGILSRSTDVEERTGSRVAGGGQSAGRKGVKDSAGILSGVIDVPERTGSKIAGSVKNMGVKDTGTIPSSRVELSTGGLLGANSPDRPIIKDLDFDHETRTEGITIGKADVKEDRAGILAGVTSSERPDFGHATRTRGVTSGKAEVKEDREGILAGTNAEDKDGRTVVPGARLEGSTPKLSARLEGTTPSGIGISKSDMTEDRDHIGNLAVRMGGNTPPNKGVGIRKENASGVGTMGDDSRIGAHHLRGVKGTEGILNRGVKQRGGNSFVGQKGFQPAGTSGAAKGVKGTEGILSRGEIQRGENNGLGQRELKPGDSILNDYRVRVGGHHLKGVKGTEGILSRGEKQRGEFVGQKGFQPSGSNGGDKLLSSNNSSKQAGVFGEKLLANQPAVEQQDEYFSKSRQFGTMAGGKLLKALASKIMGDKSGVDHPWSRGVEHDWGVKSPKSRQFGGVTGGKTLAGGRMTTQPDLEDKTNV